jgi:phage shock protein C
MILERTMRDKKIAGVCGGIAKKLDINSTSLRWIFALLVLFGGISGWIYLVLWIIIPSDNDIGDYRGD